MKLQSTILKTKKRLSSSSWDQIILYLSLILLLCLGTTFVRLPGMSFAYGSLSLNIPIVSLSRMNEELSSFESKVKTSTHEINKSTPVVILDYEAFYFGSLSAFTNALEKTDNKYRVDHIDHTPQLGNLLDDLKKWDEERTDKSKGEQKTLILLSAKAVPLAILSQVIAGIKNHSAYSNIVIGNGLL